MKKISFLLFAIIIAGGLSAQTYSIVSRNNDTIKMFPNSLGSGLKSIIPGGSNEAPQYRLIKKVDQGKESLIFVDFTRVLDKIMVAYETDLVTPGEWHVTTISYSDLYNAVVRKDAIYLSGSILGMKVEMFQRPSMYDDLVNIDGIEFSLPLKLAVYESDLAQKAEKEKEKELQRIEREKKEKEKEQKAGYDEATIMELAAKDENKAYVALLVKTQSYERSYMSDIKKYFSYNELLELIQSLTVEQLEEKAKGHSKYFEKYKAYAIY